MSASTWQEAQAPVPLPDNLASYRKPRPCRMVRGIAFVPTGISLSLDIWEVPTTVIVLEISSRAYKICESALSASPRGPRLFLGSAFEPEPLGNDTSAKESTLPF